MVGTLSICLMHKGNLWILILTILPRLTLLWVVAQMAVAAGSLFLLPPRVLRMEQELKLPQRQLFQPPACPYQSFIPTPILGNKNGWRSTMTMSPLQV